MKDYQDALTKLKDAIKDIHAHRQDVIDSGGFGSPLEKKLSESSKMACNSIDILNQLSLGALGVCAPSIYTRDTTPPIEEVYGDWPNVPHTGTPKGR